MTNKTGLSTQPVLTWKDLPFGILLLALLGVVVISIGPGWERAASWWEEQDLPAWVQAVGSILAIIGATFIASWQTTRAENAAKELRRQDAIAKFHSVRALFLQSSAVFQIGINISKMNYNRNRWQALLDEIDSIRNQFNSLPILELPGTQTGSRISLNVQNLRGLRATAVKVLQNDNYVSSEEANEILEKYLKRCEVHFDWIAMRLLDISDRQEFIREMGEDIYQRTLKLRADEMLREHPFV